MQREAYTFLSRNICGLQPYMSGWCCGGRPGGDENREGNRVVSPYGNGSAGPSAAFIAERYSALFQVAMQEGFCGSGSHR